MKKIIPKEYINEEKQKQKKQDKQETEDRN